MPNYVPRTGGNLPNGSFIPEVWSKKLQKKYYAATVLDDIVNHDYEGEIKSQGSKVIIRVRPTVNIGDYAVNGNVTYQDLQDDKLELMIDKAKFYAFKVDDIDKAQQDINAMNEATQDAARNMAIKVDTEVLGATYVDAATQMAAQQVTKTNFLDWLLAAGQSLDELNVPEEGRFIVIPPWLRVLAMGSDLRPAYLTGDAKSPLRTGKLGEIDRFSVYLSNNLSVTGATPTTHCIAGTKDGISFASQFVKTETVRLQSSFGDAIRGLNVYGFKVVKPQALVHMPAFK